MSTPSSEALTAADVSEMRQDHRRLIVAAGIFAALAILGIVALLFSGEETKVPTIASPTVSTAPAQVATPVEEPVAEPALVETAEFVAPEAPLEDDEAEVEAASDRPHVARMGGRRSMHEATMEPVTMEAVTTAMATTMEPEPVSMHEATMEAPSMMRSVADDVVFNPYRQ